ncbi:unnamed protein product [Somion occarium]|uniref:Uncharacterized protein n=1 Tax=Somion occarium TaxID=3059160 RepID=A0ABP1CUH5_9APHY
MKVIVTSGLVQTYEARSTSSHCLPSSPHFPSPEPYSTASTLEPHDFFISLELNSEFTGTLQVLGKVFEHAFRVLCLISSGHSIGMLIVNSAISSWRHQIRVSSCDMTIALARINVLCSYPNIYGIVDVRYICLVASIDEQEQVQSPFRITVSDQ